jgi:electron transport complex protein RnfB
LLENVTGQATGWAAWSTEQAQAARTRYDFYSYRRRRDVGESAQRLEVKAELKLSDLAAHSQHTDAAVLDKKRAVIVAALARARAARLAGATPPKTNLPDVM